MSNKESIPYQEAFSSFSRILYEPKFPNESIDDLGKIMNILNSIDRDKKIAESRAKMWKKISQTLFVTMIILSIVSLLYAYYV